MLEQLEMELRLIGSSEKTIQSYVFHNRRFLEFIKRTPEEIETDDVKQYITHLVSDKKLKPSSVNLAICSLMFFYERVLEKDILKRIRFLKQERKLPTVLTRDEVRKLLDSATNGKHRLLLEVLYSAGLRVSEAVNLKFEDLDLNERIGIVRQGKGKKDRLFILSNALIRHIRHYQEQMREKGIHSEYLFLSQKGKKKPISIRQAQKIVTTISKEAGIRKRVFCHALRSTFATHLLESGTDIRVIQELLGHASISTTQRYTVVSNDLLKKVESPLDSLKGEEATPSVL